ncbi:MAG: hypothetical protein HQM08_00950 [Candidatus Riflebacteria bacterium]|nr:hypothetical protein [Candidatus Riflebacteria bacterium]
MFEEKIIILALFFFLSCSAYSQDQGFIDSRLLLLSHPIFRSLDLKTKSFSNGNYKISENVDKEKKSLNERINSLQKQVETASNTIRQEFTKARTLQERQTAENKYWETRRDCEKQIQNTRSRLSLLENLENASDGQGVPGKEALLLQLSEIIEDLKTVVLHLAKRYSLKAVTDVAPLTENPSPKDIEVSILQSTHHSEFFQDPQSKNFQIFGKWLFNARLFWQLRLPEYCNSPYKLGFKDLRNESIKELYTVLKTKEREK